MKIFVKETKELSVQTLLPLFHDSVTIVPLLSIDDVLYTDLIIVSQVDSSSIMGLNNYHVVIYEKFFEELSTRLYEEYNYNHDYYYLKNALRHVQDTNISTIVSGSSYGAFGINLACMDDTVNLSSISQDLYYSLKLLYHACELNRSIKNIVLCVGYYYFYCDLSLTKNTFELQRLSRVYYPLFHDSHNCLILPTKTDYHIQNNIVDFEKILNTYAVIDYQKGFFNEERPRSQHATKEWDVKSKNWSDLSLEEQDKAGRSRAQKHNSAISHIASFNENVNLFQEFVHFCSTREIKLLLTVMPITSHYLKYLNPEYKNSFYTVLDGIDGNIHLLDLSDDRNFNNNIDFNDTDHLSDSGAIKLSQIVSSILNEINS